jgi:elongation factor P--beta-lysine ligase
MEQMPPTPAPAVSPVRAADGHSDRRRFSSAGSACEADSAGQRQQREFEAAAKQGVDGGRLLDQECLSAPPAVPERCGIVLRLDRLTTGATRSKQVLWKPLG